MIPVTNEHETMYYRRFTMYYSLLTMYQSFVSMSDV